MAVTTSSTSLPTALATALALAPVSSLLPSSSECSYMSTTSNPPSLLHLSSCHDSTTLADQLVARLTGAPSDLVMLQDGEEVTFAPTSEEARGAIAALVATLFHLSSSSLLYPVELYSTGTTLFTTPDTTLDTSEEVLDELCGVVEEEGEEQVVNTLPLLLSSLLLAPQPSAPQPLSPSATGDLDLEVESHMRRAEGGGWQCTTCGWTTKFRARLWEHVEATHTQSAGYSCPACNKFCSSFNAYKIHKTRYHKGDLSLAPSRIAVARVPKALHYIVCYILYVIRSFGCLVWLQATQVSRS